jgi:hypothetical protein
VLRPAGAPLPLVTVVDALSVLLNVLCPGGLDEHAASYGLTAL